jgi:hypothetical protein
VTVQNDLDLIREMIRSSRPRSGSEEAHDAWDDALDMAYAALARVRERIEQLEAALREIKNTLGPDSVMRPTDGPEGLIAEAAEALRIAKDALAASQDGEQR